MTQDPATEAKNTIQQIVTELYRIDGRLETLAEGLPTHEEHFEMLAELRACIETVRGDLISDAIETLHTAATSSRERARQRWLARKRCMAAVMA